MESRDTIRFWAGALGAMALVAAIVAVVVMVRMPPPKSQKATQATKPTQTAKSAPPMAKATPPVAKAASEPHAPAKSPAAPKPQGQPTATTAAKATPATATPLSDAERKLSEELWVEQKKVDSDSARLATATSDGRRRITQMIAKQFSVSDTLINDLRGRKLGYGEMAATLAFSQQLMKRDKVSRQQAIDRVIAARKAGQGWAAYARGAGLKIADVVGEVRTTDRQLAKLAPLKAAR